MSDDSSVRSVQAVSELPRRPAIHRFAEFEVFCRREWVGREVEWFRITTTLNVLASYLDFGRGQRILHLGVLEPTIPIELVFLDREVAENWTSYQRLQIVLGVESVEQADNLLKLAQGDAFQNHVSIATIVDTHDIAGIADASFDAVLAPDVSSRWGTRDQVAEFFNAASRVLKPGGHLFTTFPCRHAHVAWSLAQEDAWEDLDDLARIYQLRLGDEVSAGESTSDDSPSPPLTAPVATELLEASGLSVLELIECDGYAPWIPAGVWTRIRQLGECAFDAAYSVILADDGDSSCGGTSMQVLAVAEKVNADT